MKHLTHCAALIRAALASVTLAGLAACGGGDGTASSTATDYTVSGIVVKGPVAGSKVSAFELTEAGLGKSLGSFVTGAGGTFSFILTAKPTTPVVLEASDGTYVSEADGSTVNKVSDFYLVLPNVGPAGAKGLVLSPLTDMVAARAVGLVQSKTPTADALGLAEKLLTTHYGLKTAALPTLMPAYDKASIGSDGFLLGFVLGSLDTCDKALPTALRGSLFDALSEDFMDGIFDGKNASETVTFTTGGALSRDAGTYDFLACAALYASSGNAIVKAGISANDIAPVLEALRLAVTNSPATPKPIVNTDYTISGSVIKGVVSGSVVNAYALDGKGAISVASIGSATTSAGGTFSFRLSGTPTTAVMLVATGGNYVSEADGTTVSKTADFRLIVPGVGVAGVQGVVLSPLTDMVTARALELLKVTTLADALAQAETLLVNHYGIATPSLSALLPSYAQADIGKPAFLTGMVLGSLDTCDSLLPKGLRGALFNALSLDFSDGLFDGKYLGKPITLAVGAGLLNSTAGTSDFLACVANYSTAGFAIVQAKITAPEVKPTVDAIRTAVANSAATPKSVGLSVGSSGAISALAFGGKQWVFIAARAQGVVAVDVTDPDAAQPPTKVFSVSSIDPGGKYFGGNPIGGVVPLVGADHPQLLVYAYGGKGIALINADTGAVDYAALLPIKATSPVVFSGGSAYIAGAIPDTGRDGVWLATADGYTFFDRATQQLGINFGFSGPASLAENLGGDIANGYLFAPNYGNADPTIAWAPGVQLADLKSGQSYFFDGDIFRKFFPNFNEPDGGAVDGAYQVGIITNEDTPDIGFINMKTIVKTFVPKGRNTFEPGADGSLAVNLNDPLGYLVLSGSAVDSDTHMALFMAGYSSDVVVGLLQDPAKVGPNAPWTGLSNWRSYKSLPGYNYATDPHAVAVIKNLSNSKPYGYLLDGSASKCLQIDMVGFLAEPAKDGPARFLVNNPTVPATDFVKPLVRPIQWSTVLPDAVNGDAAGAPLQQRRRR